MEIQAKTQTQARKDINGFRPHKAQELREAIADVKNNKKKKFSSVDALVKDMLS